MNPMAEASLTMIQATMAEIPRQVMEKMMMIRTQEKMILETTQITKELMLHHLHKLSKWKVVLEQVVTVAIIQAANLVVEKRKEDMVTVTAATAVTATALLVEVKVATEKKEGMAKEEEGMAKREATAQREDHTPKFP